VQVWFVMTSIDVTTAAPLQLSVAVTPPGGGIIPEQLTVILDGHVIEGGILSLTVMI
jgi:hypothetical protein